MIPYGRQSISDADVQAVVEVLRSDWITQGPAIERFEAAVTDHVGAAHGVAVCNATAALHLACLALGVGAGDRVWTSPNTFVASANCARYCGATVDFVDIDADTYNLSVTALAAKLQAAASRNALPKVVIPVHFAGQPCDMEGIAQLARRYGFKVIEDASHAIGADQGDGKVGNCAHSQITVFSFHPVKIITTGEGGMLATNDGELAASLRRLRSHGITRDIAAPAADQGAWYYQQIDLGYNYRMTDLQAALGASQMARLGQFLERRRQLAARYDRLLAPLPVITPRQAAYGCSAYHLYPIQVDSATTQRSRRQVFDGLRQRQIGVNVHYIPVHLQPYYRDLGFAPGQFPEAERYYAQAISLPLFPALTDAQQDEVVTALAAALA